MQHGNFFFTKSDLLLSRVQTDNKKLRLEWVHQQFCLQPESQNVKRQITWAFDVSFIFFKLLVSNCLFRNVLCKWPLMWTLLWLNIQQRWATTVTTPKVRSVVVIGQTKYPKFYHERCLEKDPDGSQSRRSSDGIVRTCINLNWENMFLGASNFINEFRFVL